MLLACAAGAWMPQLRLEAPAPRAQSSVRMGTVANAVMSQMWPDLAQKEVKRLTDAQCARTTVLASPSATLSTMMEGSETSGAIFSSNVDFIVDDQGRPMFPLSPSQASVSTYLEPALHIPGSGRSPVID